MIDIKLLRENPELVKENIKKKFQDQKLILVDEVLDLDGTLINLEHVTMDELVDFLIGYQDARKYRIEKWLVGASHHKKIKKLCLL